MKNNIIKFETPITFILIISYLVLNSYCLNNYGLTDFRSFILNLILVFIIVIYIFKNNLGSYYGLTSFPKLSQYLYFLPLLLMISVNLWNGININNTTTEIIIFMLTMFLIGFLEEIIFRGFLFKMMAKDNVKLAIIVSSVTFGVGHVINLFNGASLIPTLLQIMYATSGGFLFVIIFYKSNSLWPCIITHSLINALSIFNNVENTLSLYIAPLFLILISFLYAGYIIKSQNKL